MKQEVPTIIEDTKKETPLQPKQEKPTLAQLLARVNLDKINLSESPDVPLTPEEKSLVYGHPKDKVSADIFRTSRIGQRHPEVDAHLTLAKKVENTCAVIGGDDLWFGEAYATIADPHDDYHNGADVLVFYPIDNSGELDEVSSDGRTRAIPSHSPLAIDISYANPTKGGQEVWESAFSKKVVHVARGLVDSTWSILEYPTFFQRSNSGTTVFTYPQMENKKRTTPHYVIVVPPEETEQIIKLEDKTPDTSKNARLHLRTHMPYLLLTQLVRQAKEYSRIARKFGQDELADMYDEHLAIIEVELGEATRKLAVNKEESRRVKKASSEILAKMEKFIDAVYTSADMQARDLTRTTK